MTTYTSVFGGDTVPPSDNQYVAVALSANTTFYWPTQAEGPDLMADIMEVTPTAAYDMTFPDATLVSVGKDVLVRNLGAFTITLKDSAGGTVGTVVAGAVKYLYVTNNSTAAGTWTIFTFGTGTSAADASTLAGYGLVATGSTLSQQALTVSSSIGTTVTLSQRGEVVIFTASGVVTCALPSATSAGNGFFISISNQGTGTVTINPDGAETIDGEATKSLAPGESCTIVTSGILWASIGYGRSTQFQFTKLVLDISTGTPFTLTSVQASNKLIQTIGAITGSVVVNLPAVVAVYYVQCAHTGGFTTTFKTSAGSGVSLAVSDRSILYCDGVDVVQAQTASVSPANISGGVAGALVYQTGFGTTGFSAAGTTGQVAISGGTGAPTWSDLGAITNPYSAKNPLADADEFPIADSAAAYGPKKTLWSTIKEVIGYSAPTPSKTAPIDADAFPIYDSAATTTATKMTWASIKAALYSLFQVQTATAFTTAGTSTAFTLTPTPAITANATNQRFRVNFNAAAGVTPTLAVSSQTAKNLKYYDGAGTKADITSVQVPINWITDVEYDGTDWVVLDVSGIPGVPQNSQSAAYTTVLSDAQKHILHPTADNSPRTFTIDSNANVPYTIGTVIAFVNQINTVTIAITTDTMTLAGAGSTGSRTLAANGIATALKISTTGWVISGTGLT